MLKWEKYRVVLIRDLINNSMRNDEKNLESFRVIRKHVFSGGKIIKKSIVKIEYRNKTGIDLTRALMGKKEVFLYSGGYCIYVCL